MLPGWAGAEQTRTVQNPAAQLYPRPDSTAAPIASLPVGGSLTILDQKGAWFTVRSMDQAVGWVHESVFTDTPSTHAARQSAAPFPAVTHVDQVPVREKPDIESPATAELKRGESVQVVESREGWYRIQASQGRSGWAFHTLFTRSDLPVPSQRPGRSDLQFPFQAEVVVPSGRVRETPSLSADVNYGVRNGEQVTVLSVQGEWFHIETTDGNKGWCHRSLFRRLEQAGDMENQEATTEMAAASGAPPPSPPYEQAAPVPGLFDAVMNVPLGRVRSAPSLDAGIRFSLKKGTEVTVMKTRDQWYQVRLPDGREGWSFGELYKRAQPQRIYSISLLTAPDHTEKVHMDLSGYNPPKAVALNDDGVPKVICDFAGTELSDRIPGEIAGQGGLIRQILIRRDRDASGEKRIRVVIQLAPNREYNVEQVYYQEERRYELTFHPASPKMVSPAAQEQQ